MTKHNRGGRGGRGGRRVVAQESGEFDAELTDKQSPRALVGAAARSVAGAAARLGLPPPPPGAVLDPNAIAQQQLQKSIAAASAAFKQPSAPASSSSSAATRTNPDEHPFEVGHYLVVAYRDNSPRLAKIVAVTGNKNDKAWQYYVHYFDFNRRMDEWIKLDRIVKLPSEANPLGQERVEREAALHQLKHPQPGAPAAAPQEGNMTRTASGNSLAAAATAL